MDAVFSLPDHVSPERVFDFDIYTDPRVTSDLHASYAQALKEAPDVFWTPRNGGHWMVRRYQMIHEIVNDYEYFSAREMAIPRVPDRPRMIPLNIDPPDNIPYRQALMPMFSPKAVRAMEPKIRDWAVRIVDAVADKGECDFLYDVASLFPVSVFMELMGMPLGRLREFRDLTDAFFSTHDREGVHRLSAQILGELGAFVDDRLAHPGGSDLISHLLTIEVGGSRKLTREEVLAMCLVLFLGGMDTVTNVTAFSIRQLAGDQALQRLLVSRPDRIGDFVDEGIRCFGATNTPRICTKETERFGVRFMPGDMVLNLLTIAGRDERANADAATFDIDRQESNHLTFSAGPHLCVGQVLARTEIRILTEEWLKRVPSFRPKPGAKNGFRIGTVTAIRDLPLAWEVA